MNVRISIVLILVWMATGLWSGCSDPGEVTSYVVPKQRVTDAANHVAGARVPERPIARGAAPAPSRTAAPARMLAALIPQGERQWFFKVTGPPDEVAKHAETFTTFIQSVHFAEDAGAEPTWTLPDGWTQVPGSGMRHATLQFGPPDGPLELTVIALGTVGQDQDAYTLENVNRWRGQLGLLPLAVADMADETVVVELDGTTATLVDLLGKQTGAPMQGGGPMARGPFAGASPPPEKTAPPATASLRYDTPEGWVPAELSVSRGGISVDYAAAFKVEQEGETLDVTVTPLPANMASIMLPMINRWRGQIQLGPVSQEQLDSQMQKIEIAGTQGDYIEIKGSDDAPQPQTILAVVVVADGRAWFFKSIGGSRLIEAEKERFEAFVRSVKFGDDEEANDEI